MVRISITHFLIAVVFFTSCSNNQQEKLKIYSKKEAPVNKGKYWLYESEYHMPKSLRQALENGRLLTTTVAPYDYGKNAAMGCPQFFDFIETEVNDQVLVEYNFTNDCREYIQVDSVVVYLDEFLTFQSMKRFKEVKINDMLEIYCHPEYKIIGLSTGPLARAWLYNKREFPMLRLYIVIKHPCEACL